MGITSSSELRMRGITDFVAKFFYCQQVKVEPQKSGGMNQEISIPTWKWEVINMDFITEHQRLRGVTLEISIPMWNWKVINMDFITGLPRSRKQNDFISLIVDRVTKSTNFLAIKTTYSVDDYVRPAINEIVRFHGVPLSIISDSGLQLKSHIWKSFPKRLGTQVLRLRNKEVSLLRVLWRSRSIERTTWEVEAAMMAKYPQLFPFDSV
ncbi:hypothetical protein MTR67_052075 [Solanum verrucosum]|uniref:Integrase catalytic domain-containing protein n=1 Tax=Solanum verrucosum TaxID=315347 RepID=A0AAF0V537_SOLVR|nr:hypothetical protein MTR67_052075 [Solanum verrucosum]